MSQAPPSGPPRPDDPPPTLTQPDSPAASDEPRCALLLFGSDTYRAIPLPAHGTFVIGRAADVDLALPGQAVSRRHAQLTLSRGEALLVDLGSHNGTTVDGQRVTRPHALLAGEVIGVGETRLLFHCEGGRRPRPVLPREELRQRLGEEIARLAAAQHRVVTLLQVEILGEPPERPALLAAVAPALRPGEALSCDGGTVTLLMPDLVDVEVDERVAALWTALGALARPLRAGFASCPTDAAHSDAVEAAARAAARLARAGEVRSAGSSATPLQVGEHQVLLVEPVMLETFDLLRRYARSDIPVHIHGETGTGKELAAAAVHAFSPRSAGPFLTQNCAALSETLLEAQLFGARRGAYTDAREDRAGLFEAATGGTLFLDEVGELSSAAQAKLLRVLETHRVCRLGDTREREVDARIVTATNRDLEREVREGRFRADLFFRLRVAPLQLPPLRERPRELPILARHFLSRACQRLGRPALIISSEAMQWLQAQRWEGNIRELKNTMERLAAAASPDALVLERWMLKSPPGLSLTQTTPPESTAPALRPLAQEIEELEKTRITQALAETGGVYAKAAALLDIPPRTFYNKLRRYGLVAKDPAKDPEG